MLAVLLGRLRGSRSHGLPVGSSEFVLPMVLSLAAVLATTIVLLTVDTTLGTKQHLVLGYLLPTIFIAVYCGSTFAVLTSFVSGLAAAYFLMPPKFSLYVADPIQIAELGFFLLLASIAAKAVSVLTDDVRLRHAADAKAARSRGKRRERTRSAQ